MRRGPTVVRLIGGAAYIAVAAMALVPPASSQEVLATPGFTWGQARVPSSRQAEERDNEIAEGAINQGIDWLQITDGMRVNSFVQFNFKRDTKKFDFNNELKFAVGTQLKIAVAEWAIMGVGGRYEWNRRYVSGRTPNGPVGFLSWSAAHSWLPESRSAMPLGYHLSTWGEFRYPSSQEIEERRNAIVEGAFEAATDLWKARDLLVFSTFLSLDYKADTQEFDFNNELEPALGARMRFRVLENGFIELGAKLVNEYRFVTDRSETGTIVFLNWAANW